jgi:ferredoxin--NADP+ reductase/benzoate/toluate 1,2-dioxygenase reductase subunit
VIKDSISSEPAISYNHAITQVRFLTEYTFVIRFERKDLKFKAGQRIIIGAAGDIDQREYSIYSGEDDDYLEILVREVSEGNVSVKLKNCQPGDMLQVNGPFGTMGIDPEDRYSKKLVFIATGTGISPFHSFVRSYPGIDYTLFHGVRYIDEAYERSEYDESRYLLCTSRESNEGKKGRVTKFLYNYNAAPGTIFYLCGNSHMIYEVSHILLAKGIAPGNIRTEIYF